MKVHYPGYYRKFRCVGGNCPDTCCKGWLIGIDEKTWERYKKEKGEFGKRLRSRVDRKNSCFLMEKGRCAFLNGQGLCDIQINMGEKGLCRACKDYPRHMEVFEGLREASLSLSCPEAARIVLTDKGKFTFASREKREDGKKSREQKAEKKLLKILYKAREGLFQLMADRTLPIEKRWALVLAAAHDMQTRLDKGKPEEIEEVLKRCLRMAAGKTSEKKLAPYEGRTEEKRRRMAAYMEVFRGLEDVSDSWPQRREGCMEYLEQKEKYHACHEKFLAYSRRTMHIYENLTIYFLYVYFLGAVYDGRIYEKVKFAVISCLVIRMMEEVVFVKKGWTDEMDVVGEAYVYAREIEHSDGNLEGLESILTNSPMFSLETLFTCMLS